MTTTVSPSLKCQVFVKYLATPMSHFSVSFLTFFLACFAFFRIAFFSFFLMDVVFLVDFFLAGLLFLDAAFFEGRDFTVFVGVLFFDFAVVFFAISIFLFAFVCQRFECDYF